MTTLIAYIVNHSQKSEILAAGCAILFGYLMNMCCVSILELIGKIPRANRIRLYISRILYIFGLAGVVSSCSMPGLHGVFHCVMAWISWLALAILHVAYMIDFNDPLGRKRGLAMGFYWLCCTVWWWGIMISFFIKTRHH